MTRASLALTPRTARLRLRHGAHLGGAVQRPAEQYHGRAGQCPESTAVQASVGENDTSADCTYVCVRSCGADVACARTLRSPATLLPRHTAVAAHSSMLITNSLWVLGMSLRKSSARGADGPSCNDTSKCLNPPRFDSDVVRGPLAFSAHSSTPTPLPP